MSALLLLRQTVNADYRCRCCSAVEIHIDGPVGLCESGRFERSDDFLVAGGTGRRKRDRAIACGMGLYAGTGLERDGQSCVVEIDQLDHEAVALGIDLTIYYAVRVDSLRGRLVRGGVRR